jgi:hypothetical protein
MNPPVLECIKLFILVSEEDLQHERERETETHTHTRTWSECFSIFSVEDLQIGTFILIWFFAKMSPPRLKCFSSSCQQTNTGVELIAIVILTAFSLH